MPSSPQSSKVNASVLPERPSRIAFALACLLGLACIPSAFAASKPTTTALAISSSNGSVASNASVHSGTVITLTATVSGGAPPLPIGTVSFCDATAPLCSDIHLLATAQVTPAGTAIYKFIPGPGTHTYKAVFAATPNSPAPYETSSSATATFTVTESFPTTNTLISAGTAGNYTLTSTVVGTGNTALAGSVSFVDTTTANSVLATATLGPATTALNFFNSSQPALLAVGAQVSVVGDFNGDGIADLAVTSMSLTGALTVLLGNGDGTFTTAPLSINIVSSVELALAVGDFNHDGRLDLVLVNGNPNGNVNILLGNGDGTFSQAPGSPFLGAAQTITSLSLAVGDFNQDGVQDIVLADSVFQTPNADQLIVLLGKGDGTFTSTVSSIQSDPVAMTVGDFNGDGIPDLAIANSGLSILLGVGDGTFQPATTGPSLPNQASSITTGDFNGDGIADLAVASSSQSYQYAPNVTLFLGAGNGTFSPTNASGSSGGAAASAIATGDFNGDGKVDLATLNTSHDTATYLLGNGDGTFTIAPNSPITVGTFPQAFSAADFDGDGITDTASGVVGTTGSEFVLLSRSTATASAAATSVNPLGIGAHQVDATYPGSSTYAASTSNSVALTAQTAIPTITFALSPATISTAQSLSITIAVSGPMGDPTPVGSVTVTSGSYTSAVTPLSSGSTNITIPAGALPAATDTLTATYSGDTSYSKSTASTTITVTGVPPTFTLSSTSVTIASPGASTGNTSTLTLTPAGGFTGTVSLSAVLTSSPAGAVDPPAFSFGSTSTVTVSGNTPVTATLTILTSPASSAALHTPGLWNPLTGTGALASLLFFAFPRRRRRRLGSIALASLFVLSLGALSGCSKGSNAPTNPGTTPGAYTLTVTATAGAITATTPVALTVQ